MTPRASTERCTRCLQPVSLKAKRCPHCGEILETGERKMTLWLAVLGTVGILLLVVVGLFFLDPPKVDTDNNVDKPAQGPPAQPAKKPVLD